VIEEEADRLSQLVGEAVKMAEIDAGKVKLSRVPVSSAGLLESARAGFAGRGADRVVIEPGASAEVLVDRDLMGLAIRQVLDNALKYSAAEAPVLCRTTLEGDGLALRISDQGPGIPERERDRIFEKFYRRPHTRDRAPGSGLGLHIAREIARMHGGELWAEGAAERGTTFCFRLPLSDEERA
jgi:two-component system sensor histidine kinase KdpD